MPASSPSILLLGAGFACFSWVDPIDRQLLDIQFRFLRAHALRPAPNEVVIVGIDDATTRELREPLTLWHPHVGKFLQAVASSGATAVGLDVVLPDRSFEAIVPGYDRQLLTGIVVARRAIPLVLALTVDPSGETRPVYPAFIAAAGRDATGYALLPVDCGRRGAALRRAHRGGRQHGADAGGTDWRRGSAGKSGTASSISRRATDFDYVPLHSVLAWHDAGDTQRLESAFRGKAVLVGGVFRFEDRLAAPVNLVAWDAQAVNAAGRGAARAGAAQPAQRGIDRAGPRRGSCRRWSCWRRLASGSQATSRSRCWLALAGAAALGTRRRGCSVAASICRPAAVLLTLLAAVGTRMLYEASLQLRERRRLRSAFGAYVSPDIMRDILRRDPPPGLGGERYFLCVLFADIRGFTERSERAAPEATIKLLNRYFAEVTACIHGAGGTLDKFIGDGVMAFFGAPQRLDNPCIPAVNAAREILERLPRLNAALALEGESPIAIGIGLSAGDAVVGNMGSESRHNYTAIGDAVNVASRLEGLTKDVDFPLVCSALVLREARGPLGIC